MHSCYCPQTKFAKVMFLNVSHSVHRGGLPQCMLGYHSPPDQAPPRTRAPSGPGTPQSRYPPDQAHPPAQCMLGDTVNKRAICILLECNLVNNIFDYIPIAPHSSGSISCASPCPCLLSVNEPKVQQVKVKITGAIQELKPKYDSCYKCLFFSFQMKTPVSTRLNTTH